MKRILCLLLMGFMLCSLVSCSGESGNLVIVSGELDGVDDGFIISIGSTKGRLFHSIQTDTVVNGRFRFTFIDSLDWAKPMNIVGKSDRVSMTSVDVWIVPGARIEVKGEGKIVSSWVISSDIPEQVEQSAYNICTRGNDGIIEKAMMEIDFYYDEIGRSQGRRSDLRASIDSLYTIVDSVKVDAIMAEINLMDANRTYSALWMKKLEEYASSFRRMNLDDAYIEKMMSMYESMSDELRQSDAGLTIKTGLYPPKELQAGDEIIDADMWDVDGKMHRLEYYKGKYLLLDFWSIGCPSCLASFQEMREITSEYSESLTIVGISSDSKEVWERASNEKGITWISLNDLKGDKGIRFDYGIRAIPYYVLVSPDGKVITSWAGYGDGVIRHKIKEYME